MRMLRSMRSWISRYAVSCEHFASFAHFEDVSFTSKPLRILLRTSRWRIVDCCAGMTLPEPCLAENCGERLLGCIEGPVHAANEPLQPRGDVECLLLGSLQYVVIGIPFKTDLCGHAIKSL